MSTMSFCNSGEAELEGKGEVEEGPRKDEEGHGGERTVDAWPPLGQLRRASAPAARPSVPRRAPAALSAGHRSPCRARQFPLADWGGTLT